MSIPKSLSKVSNGIELLANAMQGFDAKPLGEVTGLIFTQVLEYKIRTPMPTISRLIFNAKKVAAFILINQILFYHFISRLDSKYPPLSPCKSAISDLKEKFDIISKTNLAPIFKPNIVNFLPEKETILEALNQIISFAINEAQPQHLTSMQLLYAKLVPLDIRKHLSAYYTSPIAAQLLVNLSIRSKRDIILDLACGTGILLLTAFKRKLILQMKECNVSENHSQMHAFELLGDIYGNDVLPFATQMTAMNLALQGGLIPPPILHVTIGDAFQLRGVPPADEVLMNPPFTRHERITPEFSRIIYNRLAKEGYKEYIAGKMSLQHYFLFYADCFLKPGGRIAFVLPANTLNVNLSENLIRFLVDKKYHVEYLLAINSGTGAFSIDCNYKEYLFIARKGALTDTAQTKLIVFFSLPSLASIEDITNLLQITNESTSFEREGTKIEVKCVHTRQLYLSRKWDTVFWDLNNPFLEEIFTKFPKLVPLCQSDEFTINTGFHSTYCNFLIIPNRYFKIVQEINSIGIEILRKVDGARVIIPQKFLRSCLRESKLYQRFYALPQHWVFSINILDSIPSDVQEIFLDYTRTIIKEQVKKKAKMGGKIREHVDRYWFTHPYTTGCDTKISHCFTFNRYGLWRRRNAAIYTQTAVTANDGFHMYEYIGIDWNKQDALLLLTSWFNTSLHLFDFLRKCRVPANHVQQCLKSDRLLMYVPVIARLSPADRQTLLSATREFANQEHGLIIEQLGKDPRRKFDTVWLRVLGVPTDQIKQLLDSLYPILHHVITLR